MLAPHPAEPDHSDSHAMDRDDRGGSCHRRQLRNRVADGHAAVREQRREPASLRRAGDSNEVVSSACRRGSRVGSKRLAAAPVDHSDKGPTLAAHAVCEPAPHQLSPRASDVFVASDRCDSAQGLLHRSNIALEDFMLSLDDMPIGNGGDNFVPGASQVSSARLCAFLDLAVNLAEEQVLGVVLQRIVRDAKDRPLAFLLFGSAAWKCQDRDRFIGWTPEQREKKLGLLTNNTRFLILPWVQVPELASGTLAAVLRRLSSDWQRKYGHPITLVETFVERDRFAGTA